MPNDLNLLKSQMEVENKLGLAKFDLTDVVEVKTTADEGMAFSNAWCTYRERTDRLVSSRGKVYLLLPIWSQTLFRNRDCPYGNFFDSLPVPAWGLPVWLWGLVFSPSPESQVHRRAT